MFFKEFIKKVEAEKSFWWKERVVMTIAMEETYNNIPTTGEIDSVKHYLKQAGEASLLSKEQEYRLAVLAKKVMLRRSMN